MDRLQSFKKVPIVGVTLGRGSRLLGDSMVRYSEDLVGDLQEAGQVEPKSPNVSSSPLSAGIPQAFTRSSPLFYQPLKSILQDKDDSSRSSSSRHMLERMNILKLRISLLFIF